MRRCILLSLFLWAVASGCVLTEDYNPPPEAKLRSPETGTFFVGDSLVLEFSKPINPDTLVVQVWPGELDLENELIADAPLLANCTTASSPCGTATFTLSEDRMEATLTLDPAGLGQADVPYALEVTDALRGEDGVKRGVPAWFNFQFKPARPDVSNNGTNNGTGEPIEFEDGVYIVVGTIMDPLPATLNLVTDMQVLSDGRLAFSGAEGDEIEGAAKNTANPEELTIDAGPEGFAILGYGTIVLSDSGERFLESEPLLVELKLGPIIVALTDLRLTGKVFLNEATGHDKIEGTISFASVVVTINDNPTEYEAGSTTFVADWVAPELVPEGTPMVCGEVCGVVTGVCNPPADFPAEEFCLPEEEMMDEGVME